MKHRENVWSEGYAVYLLYCGHNIPQLDAMDDNELLDAYCEHIQKYDENADAKKAQREYCISFM